MGQIIIKSRRFFMNKFVKANKKIENAVVSGYKAI